MLEDMEIRFVFVYQFSSQRVRLKITPRQEEQLTNEVEFCFESTHGVSDSVIFAKELEDFMFEPIQAHWRRGAEKP